MCLLVLASSSLREGSRAADAGTYVLQKEARCTGPDSLRSAMHTVRIPSHSSVHRSCGLVLVLAASRRSANALRLLCVVLRYTKWLWP